VAHKSLQRYEVPTALAQEAVCEAVTQLVRRELPDTGALADTQTIRISAWSLAGFFGSLSRRSRSNAETHWFDFDSENVVV
jgi:hypothetical protein